MLLAHDIPRGSAAPSANRHIEPRQGTGKLVFCHFMVGEG